MIAGPNVPPHKRSEALISAAILSGLKVVPTAQLMFVGKAKPGKLVSEPIVVSVLISSAFVNSESAVSTVHPESPVILPNLNPGLRRELLEVLALLVFL